MYTNACTHLAIVGDARETVAELDAALGDWTAPAGWTERIAPLMAEWNALLDDHQKPTNAPLPTYAQAIAAVHAAARPTDPIVTAPWPLNSITQLPSHSRSCGQMRPQISGMVEVLLLSSYASRNRPSAVSRSQSGMW